MAAGNPLIHIQLLCCADEHPAIYCEDVLDKNLLKRDYQSQEHKVGIFRFLKEFCDVEAYMDLTDLHAAVADENLADILKIPCGTPVLHMQEVDYDINGNPVFYSRQYFVDDYVKHTVLRKKF